MSTTTLSEKDWIALRFVGGSLALVTAGVAAVVFMIAAGALDVRHVTGTWLPVRGPLLLAMETNRAAVAAGGLFVGLLALVAFLRVLRPGRRATSALHLLSADDQGFVVVDSRGIATIATQAAISTRGVVEAAVRISGSGTSPVRIKLEVGVYPGANVKRAGDDARVAVHRAVEELVGIGIRDVRVTVRVLDPDNLSALLAS